MQFSRELKTSGKIKKNKTQLQMLISKMPTEILVKVFKLLPPEGGVACVPLMWRG